MKRRIALISEHASPLAALGSVDSGGQNVYVGQVALELARMGHEVDVFTRRESPDEPLVQTWRGGVRVIQVAAGPVRPVPKEQLLPYMDEFARFVIRWCRRKQWYSLLHANFWTSGLVALEVWRALGIPYVVTFHALGRVRRLHHGGADGFPDERFAAEERVIAGAAAVIAECPQDREDLVSLYGADPASVAVIACGFDPSELWPVPKRAARARLGLPQDRPLVLQLGRMVERKGIDTAIRAFARARREFGIDGQLCVAGGDHGPDGPCAGERLRLHDVAAAEGALDVVTFVGPVAREELATWYSAADVFVTLPWYEPFGITPLESMACGTPVVGSDVGGIRHTVTDGETGYLVPPRDDGAAADRIARLIADPGLARQMGDAGIRRVQARFTWDRIAGEIAALYEDVLRDTGEGAAGAGELRAVEASFDGLEAALRLARRELPAAIAEAAANIARCLASGGKVLVCGNGGSAADAQHFAAEFVGRFRAPGRRAYPAIALNADTAVMTAWANDASFDDVFARQVEALAAPGDVLLAISTSGQSRNVVRALEAAREAGIASVALLGRDGGAAGQLATLPLIVRAEDTQHIQEVHGLLVHLICELAEARLVAPAPVQLPAPELLEVTA